MIPLRERNAIIQSLSAGVVPAVGLQHFQVGRNDEVQALVKDLEIIASGGATCRFIIGRFGSGKTFFLHLLKTVALQKRFVVVEADITTDRRLHGTAGQARALYSELLHRLGTRAKPEGGALANLVERWVGDVDGVVREKGGTDADVRRELLQRLKPLHELVSGFDFANVIAKYFDGYLTEDDQLRQAALRWLRGEYATKTEARQELGVRTIIEDDTVYDSLKLLAEFVRMAGYAGLLVSIDELVVLSHRLNNSIARNNNYEALLRIFNDCVQGRASGIGFLFAGTPESLEDRRRGIFSYEALATRLASNRFSEAGGRDLNAPVVRLDNLTAEDCFVLLTKLREVFYADPTVAQTLPNEAIVKYLEVCQQRMGAAYFQTPRDTVKDFIGLLQKLQQNPDSSWQMVLAAKQAEPPVVDQTNMVPGQDGDDLSQFQL
ncbi:MAG TPA: ATP-binding protein [Planctomycetaceae bacterium]|nr:ATP-binding protein [Planctomycetaceae bacterium]